MNDNFNEEEITARSTKAKQNTLAAPMKNDIDDQNCYVNVIIHTLHYIPEIFEFLTKESIANSTNDHRLLIELHKLLERYNELTSKSCNIPEEDRYCNVYDLRRELESLLKGERLFQLGLAGDPVDLLFIFFNAFHSYAIKANSLKYCVDKECKPVCPSHELFVFNLVQQLECKNCKATSDLLKFDYNYFIHDIKMKEIILKIESFAQLDDFSLKLFNFAKEISAKTASGCPSKCGKANVRNNTILLSNCPYLCFSLSWKEINPKLTDICKMFYMLPLKVNNSAIFEVYNRESIQSYELFGIICYWAGHHVCFFKSLEKEDGQRYWIFHDDRTISRVKSWKDLIILCLKSHYHPVMLFYNDSGSKATYYDDSSHYLSEKDYQVMIAHCEKIENDTQIQEESESLRARIRPVLDLKKSNDLELQRSIASLQKIEEMKFRKSQNIQDNDENTKIQLEDEEPSIDQSNWKCTYNNCNNYNNYSTYQCVRCQTMNIKVFELIKQNKESRTFNRINTENKSSKLEVLNKSITLKNSLLQSNGSLNDFESVDLVDPNFTNPLKKKKKKMNPHHWECPYCLSINESEFYCFLCKKNRPVNEQYTIKEKMINSVKHYL